MANTHGSLVLQREEQKVNHLERSHRNSIRGTLASFTKHDLTEVSKPEFNFSLFSNRLPLIDFDDPDEPSMNSD